MLLQNIAQHNDEASFSKLFNLMYARLVKFSQHYVQSVEIAEEIVSDVFVRLWNNRENVGTIEQPEAYLYVAVKNKSLNHVDRAPRSFVQISASHGLDLHDLIDVFNPEKELEIQELYYNLNLAIETLPSQCKAVFKMIKEDGFKYKEVAEIMHISPRTVETQLVRALKRLDMALAPFVEKKLKKKQAKSKNPLRLPLLLFSFFV